MRSYSRSFGRMPQLTLGAIAALCRNAQDLQPTVQLLSVKNLKDDSLLVHISDGELHIPAYISADVAMQNHFPDNCVVKVQRYASFRTPGGEGMPWPMVVLKGLEILAKDAEMIGCPTGIPVGGMDQPAEGGSSEDEFAKGGGSDPVMDRQGVRLTGVDQPTEGDGSPIRIFVAVAVTDPELAPTRLCLVVKASTPEGTTRTARTTKLLVQAETGMGIELPLVEEGTHVLQVLVCAAAEDGGAVLFECEPRECRVPPRHVTPSTACGLPRLMHSAAESIVLCGVNIPREAGEGVLRVMVALKRVWHDAPRDLALIVRDELPCGGRRAAVVHRTLGDEPEAFGLCVPMGEAGVHRITCQIAKRVGGEYIEVFKLDEQCVSVCNAPAPIIAECGGVQLTGVDVPDACVGSLRAIVAVRRTDAAAPSKLCLLVKDKLPDGTTRTAVVRKSVAGLDETAIGAEVAMPEAGTHAVELCVAEEKANGSFEILLRVPPVHVTAVNPPMPKIMEDGNRALVLCGVDVNGGRWPGLCAEEVVDGTLRVQVAVARTWDDAPTELALVVRETMPCGRVRTAVARRTICDLEPAALGLQVPVEGDGDRMVSVVVAEGLHGGELMAVFELPPVRVHSPVQAPAAFELAPKAPAPRVAPAACAAEDVTFKVTLAAPVCDAVIRRVTVGLEMAPDGTPSGGFAAVAAALRRSFCAELGGGGCPRVSYVDEDGDDIVVSTDDELGQAIRMYRGKGGVVRLCMRA